MYYGYAIIEYGENIMTREERKEYIKQYYTPHVWGNLETLVDEIYYDFEQRITELEADNKELAKEFTHSKYVDKYKELETPRTCEGCKHRGAGGYDCTHWSSKQEDCCSRFVSLIDYYELKDTE